MMPETRPAWETTEFWLTILTNLAVIAMMVMGKVSPELGLGFMTGGNGLYSLARGLAKNGVSPGGEQPKATATAIIHEPPKAPPIVQP
jgi:L-asparagine transporter-like permease